MKLSPIWITSHETQSYNSAIWIYGIKSSYSSTYDVFGCAWVEKLHPWILKAVFILLSSPRMQTKAVVARPAWDVRSAHTPACRVLAYAATWNTITLSTFLVCFYYIF